MNIRVLAAAVFGLSGMASSGEEFVLKVHHPLPPTSTAHQQVLQPWCDKIAKESGMRMKCQIYPNMQLGGSPPQLYDQLKDGVVDVIWTIPSYAAGRFPVMEVFELPFMMRDAQAASKAVWQYVQKYDAAEFKDVKPLAFHTHGGGLFHMVKSPVRTLADLKGVKVRAPTRQTTRLLTALGASPVGMPIPQVADGLSKGVIDGALLPYEIVPAIKANELTNFHSEPGVTDPTIHTSVFILAMNNAKYASLPEDLKKIIEANSGIELSAQIGRIFADMETINRKLLPPSSINVIAKDEIARWRTAAQPVIDDWLKEVSSKGHDGKALLEHARGLIAKYGK